MIASASPTLDCTWGRSLSRVAEMVVPDSVASSLKASIAPRAVPRATAATNTQMAVSMVRGAIEKTRFQGRRIQTERTFSGDENVIQFEIVAARAAQAYDLPGVEDLSGLHRRKQHDRFGPARTSFSRGPDASTTLELTNSQLEL